MAGSPPRTTFTGPYKRPDLEGLWYRKFETWTDDRGREMGAWSWVPSEVYYRYVERVSLEGEQDR